MTKSFVLAQACALLYAAWLGLGARLPADFQHDDVALFSPAPSIDSANITRLAARQDIPKKKLQLMCLGASIVFGIGSSDGNGQVTACLDSVLPETDTLV